MWPKVSNVRACGATRSWERSDLGGNFAAGATAGVAAQVFGEGHYLEHILSQRVTRKKKH